MEERDMLTLIVRFQFGPAENTEGEKDGTPPSGAAFLFEGPDAITVKEAQAMLKASREKVDDMRRKGELTSYYRKRQVRLDRREVEKARKWWSVRKGKV